MRLFNNFAIVILGAALLAPTDATADGGFYVGVGAGGATQERDLDNSVFTSLPSSIDEDDTATKFFAGYNIELAKLTLGIEAGYTDFGEPDVDVNSDLLLVETSGINLWGTAAIEVGPIDVYGKLGAILWDYEATFQSGIADDDGTDIGYGLGARYAIGSFEVRGEYELYDLDGADIAMLSLGLAYRF